VKNIVRPIIIMVFALTAAKVGAQASSALPQCPAAGPRDNCQAGNIQFSGGFYSGEFKDGKPDGVGVFHYSSGNRYEGMFQKGQPNGSGKFTFKNGNVTKGNFLSGRPDGFGSILYAFGGSYVGNFREGKRDGLGIEYKADGSIRRSGKWSGDRFVDSLSLEAISFPFESQVDYNPRAKAVALVEKKEYTSARIVLSPLVSKGEPWALDLLARLELNGWGGLKNPVAAAGLSKRGSDAGYEPSSLQYARLLILGKGVEKDVGTAMSLIRPIAEKNNLQAINLMGILYFDGIGVKEDRAQAFRYWQRVEELGGDGSNLAFAYMHGAGGETNYGKALDIALRCSRAGNGYCSYLAGKIYLDGLGVAPNFAKAQTFLERAADLDTPLGSLTLAELYFAKPELNSSNRSLIDLASRVVDTDFIDSEHSAAKLRAERLIGKIQQSETIATRPQLAEGRAKLPPIEFAPRKALVIGNDNYRKLLKLDNAVADAAAIGRGLEQLGYTVYRHSNLDEKSFKKAIRDFKAAIDKGDEILFFYAGHGVQIAGSNFLIPVDLNDAAEDQVRDEAIHLQKIIDDFQERRPKLAVTVIDACRDNPFGAGKRTSGTRGLAPTTPATGQLILFSAGSGQQALDKLGKNDRSPNSVFTRVFLREIMKPGIPIDRVLRNVRIEVVTLARSIGHEQTPALYDQLVGDFYFKR
jgi:TPR repeat protein